MLQLVRAQGGDTRLIFHPENYPMARYRKELRTASSGYLAGFDTREIGLISVALGAGRLKANDPVDHQAGIILRKKVGDRVNTGDILMEIHTNKSNILNHIKSRLKAAVKISTKPPQSPQLILKRLVS
jgi:thymidine phosphorylase